MKMFTRIASLYGLVSLVAVVWIAARASQVVPDAFSFFPAYVEVFTASPLYVLLHVVAAVSVGGFFVALTKGAGTEKLYVLAWLPLLCAGLMILHRDAVLLTVMGKLSLAAPPTDIGLALWMPLGIYLLLGGISAVLCLVTELVRMARREVKAGMVLMVVAGVGLLFVCVNEAAGQGWWYWGAMAESIGPAIQLHAFLLASPIALILLLYHGASRREMYPCALLPLIPGVSLMALPNLNLLAALGSAGWVGPVHPYAYLTSVITAFFLAMGVSVLIVAGAALAPEWMRRVTPPPIPQ